MLLATPPVLDFGVAELPSDDPKQVFRLVPDTGLGLLQFLHGRNHRGVLVQRFTLGQRHGDVQQSQSPWVTYGPQRQLT